MTAPHNGTETSITAAKKVDESGRAAALRDKIYNWFLERGPDTQTTHVFRLSRTVTYEYAGTTTQTGI